MGWGESMGCYGGGHAQLECPLGTGGVGGYGTSGDLDAIWVRQTSESVRAEKCARGEMLGRWRGSSEDVFLYIR